MNNIRIWTEDEKRCEALWLGYLLTLCGCQVWTVRLDAEYQNSIREDKPDNYIDILLSDSDDAEQYAAFLMANGCKVLCISRTGKTPAYMGTGSLIWWKTSVPLDLGQMESLKVMMSELSKYIARSSEEQMEIMRLTTLFIRNENELFKGIYTITEMFCSRRIDYAKYHNVDVIVQTIPVVEDWLQDYISGMEQNKALTYVEKFTVVYLQNLVDEAYIKARRRGGYDVSRLLKNANYMLSYETGAEAALFLKLQILHNAIIFEERPDDILNKLIEQMPSIYCDKAFREVGDIYREESERVSDRNVEDYYEAADCNDIQNFGGLYRAGLVYQDKGRMNFRWYKVAGERYEQVIRLISKVPVEYRTPQEFEYFYKACYGKIKVNVALEKSIEILTENRKTAYHGELEKLIDECINIEQVHSLQKIYGNNNQQIIELMKEKMEKVQGWARNLISEMNQDF